MIVAAVVIDKLAILHLLEQAEFHRSGGGAIAIMPDGSTHVNADPHIQGYPPTARFTLAVGREWMSFECERAELAKQSRAAYVYHLAESEMPRWRAANDAVKKAIERERRATEATPASEAEGDEDGPAQVRREWQENTTPAVRSARDLEVARGRYAEMLASLGMTEGEAEQASERAAAMNPTTLVKRFAPEAYYEMVQGWALELSSCHFTLKLMHWSITLSKYGGDMTLYRANVGVYTAEVSIALSHMEMIKKAIELARAYINEHERKQDPRNNVDMSADYALGYDWTKAGR